jgi:hypothetical protein
VKRLTATARVSANGVRARTSLALTIKRQASVASEGEIFARL